MEKCVKCNNILEEVEINGIKVKACLSLTCDLFFEQQIYKDAWEYNEEGEEKW